MAPTGPSAKSSEKPILRCAAEYVRMSTEHQQYSTLNQGAKIREYASQRGIEIVRTYADEGKSGLNIGGRLSLQRLIRDVESGQTDFQAILVYDVSRWGRFQDADESAYYEYICRRAGIQVCYCAEQFENDGSPVSTIVKSVKRAMAGEFSRELSAKVFAGHCRLIELGFRQTGSAGFGLRRILIDQYGAIKATLVPGDRKSLQTDRVILMPGPESEVKIVIQIYEWFTVERISEGAIVERLNKMGILTDRNRNWTRATVHEVLRNPKYIGNNVYNQRSFKLKKQHVVNRPEMWIKKEGAFQALISIETFEIAQRIRCEKEHRATEVLIYKLRCLYQVRGFLSGLMIDATEGMPSSNVYVRRFGSLLKAYEAIGYVPDRSYLFLEIKRSLRALYQEVVDRIQLSIADLGGSTEQDPATSLLHVNQEFTVSVVLVRCQTYIGGRRRWKVRFDASLTPDITVVVRLVYTNTAPMDYYVLPRSIFGNKSINLAEDNSFEYDAFRFDSLDCLNSMAKRVQIGSFT